MPVDLYGFLLISWIPINIFMLDVYRMQAARLGEHHVDYGMSLYRMSQYKELLSLIGHLTDGVLMLKIGQYDAKAGNSANERHYDV